MTDTDRPLSERLAFALSTLYAAADLAGQRHPTTGQPACPQALREAARAYAQVADEADGIADPQIAALTARAEKAEAEASKWYKAAADGIDAMGEHGRVECDRLAVKVAELEATNAATVTAWQNATNADTPLDAANWIADHIVGDVAWQAATGCKAPGEVKVLTEAMLVKAVASVIKPRDAMGRQYAADYAADIVRALTASGPIVLPAKPAPTDEEIAPEIHCAGCGTATSKAWECADCAAGGDAGREADRLRGAVVEAADRWTDDSDPDATRYETRAANLMRAVRALRTHRTQPVKS